ncbi:MAG: siphovirus Gp157 family protein [Trichlorobacter sp.]|jgi:hypothetical protein|nr:siphovirus Gp157 family protein [Trichlorobacter sp.]
MSLPTLYALTEDFTKLMEMEEPDEIENILVEIVANEIEQKTESVCKFIKVLDSTAEQFKAEEERIREARKSLENKAERVRDYMKQALLNANIDKVNAGTFKVSVGLSPGSVTIDDLASIPPRFLTIIPEQHQPDKAAIKAAIKAGESVPGAHIEAGFTLRIR